MYACQLLITSQLSSTSSALGHTQLSFTLPLHSAQSGDNKSSSVPNPASTTGTTTTTDSSTTKPSETPKKNGAAGVAADKFTAFLAGSAIAAGAAYQLV
ncbi:hypothetical protein THASP1DRAFT_27771 [Thamnocephalis sphaerospora]|uniref:Uncharacterized protein n=1 Tax=Thamnocephalis sphaerospora TaxID=78915 RepID=A0A4P9XVX5_9FUNG|nr:hypothetical protein THASP1DRAFT_27771 [Thamnocephalis sphaerospora]|eukprot:RKP10444.1 hypothetical protein THASP1DRAFT_27771 [Thamnocephalis sphaerospora]